MTYGSTISPSAWIVSHGTSWKKKHSLRSITNQSCDQPNSAGFHPYLGLGATSASHGRGQGAGTAAALVAHLLTEMDCV